MRTKFTGGREDLSLVVTWADAIFSLLRKAIRSLFIRSSSFTFTNFCECKRWNQWTIDLFQQFPGVRCGINTATKESWLLTSRLDRYCGLSYLLATDRLRYSSISESLVDLYRPSPSMQLRDCPLRWQGENDRRSLAWRDARFSKKLLLAVYSQ